MADRFRGFLPVVVDVETGGFNAKTDALLEIAAVLLEFDNHGKLRRTETIRYHVRPFEGANLEPASLAVNGIDPDHPLRPAIDERDALQRIFRQVRLAKPIAIAPSWSGTTRRSTSVSSTRQSSVHR